MVNPAAASSANASHKRSFALCCGRRLQFRSDNVWDATLDIVTWAVEKFVLILGPILIVFASTIIYGLSWTFFTILLPMMQHKHKETGNYWIIYGHIAFVIFLLVEICFNYFMCVRTSNKGPSYDRVVRELAKATDLDYPETPQQLETFRRDYEMRMNIRVQRRHQRSIQEEEQERLLSSSSSSATATASSATTSPTTKEVENSSNDTSFSKNAIDANTSISAGASPPAESSSASDGGVKIRKTATANRKSPTPQAQKPLPSPQQVRSWMIMAPNEWGFCPRSYQPKPPRSHYDHVTKTLVLCLDHYCPWMFNAIGYFNYRYFCNFLWFVEVGMMYGVILAWEPFQNTTGPLYKHQLQEYRRTGEWKRMYPMVPINTERLPISLSFMLCLAVGVAVACLGGFHLYLCLTAQTTIEFHGNFGNRRKANRLNKKWSNPYSLGWKRNFQQIYGTQPMWKALLLPSTREPEFLPLPLPGDKGKRIHYQSATIEDAGQIKKSTAISNGGEIV